MTLIKNNTYLLLVVLLCMIFTVVGIHKLEKEVAYQQITVTEGDTLWEYAIQYANDVPTEKWIAEIVKLNNLASTTIKVGDQLQIPKNEPMQEFNQREIATNMISKEE